MAYIYGDIPFFECLVRREYTQNLESGHGEYIPAVAHAVQAKRGRSLQFQCVFTAGGEAGAAFLLPIEALCWRPSPKPFDMTYVQPWDCFSDHFTVHEASFVARGAVNVLPAKKRGQYRFTIDWAGSDLADHFEQHKHLHLVFMDDGLIGAFPNNRLLWDDPAFWETTRELPKFRSLSGEFRAEGNQAMFRRRPDAAVVPTLAPVGVPAAAAVAGDAPADVRPGSSAVGRSDDLAVGSNTLAAAE